MPFPGAELKGLHRKMVSKKPVTGVRIFDCETIRIPCRRKDQGAFAFRSQFGSECAGSPAVRRCVARTSRAASD